MCGIAGIVHLDPRAEFGREDRADLEAMLRQMQARGPDDQRIEAIGQVGLGFCRLAIVDLDQGAQPMSSLDGQIWAMTNGEIYNHRELRALLGPGAGLRTQSDCEVVVPLYRRYGSDFVQHLNGMFATALLDQPQRRLVLVRDRLGIKPLFFYRSPNKLIFASELKAILAHPDSPRRFDWRSALLQVPNQQNAQPVAGQESFFEGIEVLPGGHQLHLDLHTGEQRVSAYWNPRDVGVDPARSRASWIEGYRERLADSVRLRLMADVEYGLFLSGGIDSVAIAKLAAEHASFHTFSVLSQSTLGNGDAENARLASKKFGLENHQVYFDWREQTITPAEWQRVLWDCETHQTCGEQFYKYQLHAYARRARPNLKVILLGQGSDEFNGGYTKGQANQYNASENPSWQGFCGRRMHMQQMQLRVGQFCDVFQQLRPTSAINLPPVHVSGALPPAVLRYEGLAALAGEHAYDDAFESYRDLHRRSMQMYQLWHEDRTAAANSIENRVPFLDHRVVEWLYGVPPALFNDLFWDKRILREAMAHDLPDQLAAREKVPFFSGEDERYTRRMIHQLLRAEGDYLLEVALEQSKRDDDVLDPQVLRQVLHEAADDPDYSSIDETLRLVNMGLLAHMARELPELAKLECRVEALEIGDWARWEAEHGAQMVRRAETLNEDSVLSFAEETLLVRCETGSPDWVDEGGHYIIRGTDLRFVIEAENVEWAQFLKLVDGRRRVSELFELSGSSHEGVWKHLEEAVEQRVVVISKSPQA